MKLMLLIGILVFFSMTALAVVIALYHHKNTATRTLIIGQRCQVSDNLTPDGAVIVQGELWRARSIDGTFIVAPAVVTIIGLQDHLLLVKVSD